MYDHACSQTTLCTRFIVSIPSVYRNVSSNEAYAPMRRHRTKPFLVYPLFPEVVACVFPSTTHIRPSTSARGLLRR